MGESVEVGAFSRPVWVEQRASLSCQLTFTHLNVILHSLDLTLLAVCIVQSY